MLHLHLLDLCLILSLSLSVIHGADHEKWDYDKSASTRTGPRNWGNLYSQCSGQKQSPIDIMTAEVESDYSLREFQFDNYNIYENLILSIINSGHSAQLTPHAVTMKLSGGGLKDKYYLWQFHFHWAGTNEKGSEHTINGSHYALELHLVHYNAKYSDGYAAINSHEKDALAVLGFLFEISTVNNTAYNELVKDLELIEQHYDHNAAATIDIYHLFNYGLGPYYRYYGSLTTPGCQEVVVWSVYQNPLKISQYQLNAFRKLLNKKNETLDDNYRHTQELHNRKITYYDPDAPVLSGVETIKPTDLFMFANTVFWLSYFLQ